MALLYAVVVAAAASDTQAAAAADEQLGLTARFYMTESSNHSA